MTANVRAAVAAAPGPTGWPTARARSGDERKAALLVHALPAADREWLLEQLPAAERHAVRALLAELAALGIPADRTLVDESVASAAAPAMPPPTAAPAARAPDVDDIRSIESADPDLVASVLRGEPAGLIARLLRMRDWQWKHALLRRLDPALRERVAAALAVGALAAPPAAVAAAPASASLDRRILAALARRLREMEARAADGDRPGAGRAGAWRLSRWASWLRRPRREGRRA